MCWTDLSALGLLAVGAVLVYAAGEVQERASLWFSLGPRYSRSPWRPCCEGGEDEG